MNRSEDFNRDLSATDTKDKAAATWKNPVLDKASDDFYTCSDGTTPPTVIHNLLVDQRGSD